ncbi:hypothetical protein QVD17_12789 [Tagetes erecta]|uniref:Uncharacterized protein n=1 Tax=Tagetes erecta TaxID=13708 RepID=A0AAD8KV75_TARER|nr:hypothetical protein QVD17_12789 [Tagetes erecta]
MDQTHQTLTLPENTPPPLDDPTTVDTTRPFRSVKEAVAMFGERVHTSQIYSPSPKPPYILPKQEPPISKSTSNNSNQILWKSPDRDQEPSPVVMNTLKKLELELNETKRELKILKERESETEVALASLNAELHKNMSRVAKAEAEAARKAVVAGNNVVAKRSSMTLRQVLNGFGGERKYLSNKKVLKKKPVVPLVTDLFAWKNWKHAGY